MLGLGLGLGRLHIQQVTKRCANKEAKVEWEWIIIIYQALINLMKNLLLMSWHESIPQWAL